MISTRPPKMQQALLVEVKRHVLLRDENRIFNEWHVIVCKTPLQTRSMVRISTQCIVPGISVNNKATLNGGFCVSTLKFNNLKWYSCSFEDD